MFLSCGDALFDLFAGPDEADVSNISLNGRVGGSPLNVALGLARLGHHAGFFTKVSDDPFGRRIRAFMERERIDTRHIVPTTRNTTLAMVSLSEAGVPRYDFYIEGTADRSVEPDDVPAKFGDELLALHFASYSTVVEPTASALRHLVRQEGARRFISYDPNIRASIEPDLDRWRACTGHFVPSAALVKASEEDLEQIHPGRSIEAVLADWIGMGAAMAVVTRGDKGALAMTAGGIEAETPGLAITVADTVGAGDTFQAALLAGLHERGHLSRAALLGLDRPAVETVLAFAARAAAVTCSRRGADLPRRADLDLAPL